MPNFSKRFFAILLPAAAAVVAWAASTQISSDQPVINFRLPTFTPEGYRAWLVRGSEARFAAPGQIKVKELTLSIFTGKTDDKVETLILSPSATVLPGESVVTGENTIRVINDEFEATGSVWRYALKEKKVSITKNVRVTFHAELKDILK